MDYMREEDLREDAEFRKERIRYLLTIPGKAGAVIIELDGKRIAISEKAYELMRLNALIEPDGYMQTDWDDLYNNGPFDEVKFFYFNPRTKKEPFLFDNLKLSKKIKEIEKIKNGKNPLFDKKGKITIKIFPTSHKKPGRRVSKPDGYERKSVVPEEITSLVMEATPRELAMLGIDYREVHWVISKENLHGKTEFLESVKVDLKEYKGVSGEGVINPEKEGGPLNKDEAKDEPNEK